MNVAMNVAMNFAMNVALGFAVTFTVNFSLGFAVIFARDCEGNRRKLIFSYGKSSDCDLAKIGMIA